MYCVHFLFLFSWIYGGNDITIIRYITECVSRESVLLVPLGNRSYHGRIQYGVAAAVGSQPDLGVTGSIPIILNELMKGVVLGVKPSIYVHSKQL